MVKYFGNRTPKDLVNFSLSQGKDTQAKEEYQVVFEKSTALLLILLDELPDEKKKKTAVQRIYRQFIS